MSGKVDLREFISGFVAEAHEHLRGVHVHLLAVDVAITRGEASPRAVRELFRSLHTIKGLAGMIGVEPIVELSHAMESILRMGERAGGRLPVDAFAPLLEATQAIEQRVAALAEGRTVANAPRRLLDSLARVEQGTPMRALPQPTLQIDAALDQKLDPSDRALLVGAAGRGLRALQIGFVPSPERAAARLTITTVRERVAVLGEIVKVVPTSTPRPGALPALCFVLLVVSGASTEALRDAAGIAEDDLVVLKFAPGMEDPTELAPASSERNEADVLGSQGGVVRVDVKRLDDAMEGLAQLLVTRRRLLLAVDALAARGVDVRDLQQVLLETTRQLRDMRRAVVSLRMVSIAELCSPLPLLVRGLVNSTTRSVELTLELGRIEVDKTVGERLWPVLVHLVRNAIDHGIEPPEARAARGKPAVARLTVRAIQRSTSMVEVTVEDDGGGVDAAEVARRADAPLPRDESELLGLLTRPGLSTRAVVGTTSGRGMGLDIVRQAINEDLSGELRLTTERGVGTTFSMLVPVTIAIIDAFGFAVAGQSFLVAVGAVETLSDIDPRRVVVGPSLRRVRGRGPAAMLRHGDAIIPLFDLGEVLGQATEDAVSSLTDLPRKAVLVRRARGLVAFGVDRMLGHHEVVVRPLSDPLVRVRGITGTTDLGDGKPTLILDLGALADDRVGPGAAAGRAA